MELNFDKEMDALLRQTAQGETAFAAANPKSQIPNPKSRHLDADEISAFAENALPEKTKERYVLHLADCDKCRRNLSGLIALNSEQESEIIHAEKNEIVSPAVPWYRSLFAVPNLAYSLGALVLVFSGIAAFLLLQNAGNLTSSEVSQVYEKQPAGKGMSSDGEDRAVSESYSSNQMMSNSASMNSASNSSTNAAMPSAPVSAANSNAAPREKSDKDERDESKNARPTEPNQLAETQDAVVAATPPAPAKENEYSVEIQTQNQAQNQTQNQQNNAGSQNQTTVMPDSRSVQSAPKLSARTQNKSKNVEESRDDASKKSVAATTTVGGKTFKRADNVWYDSAYRGQSTINVTRGTSEYKKLDSKLRGIVENLGGTVVIVWKEKAFRIQ